MGLTAYGDNYRETVNLEQSVHWRIFYPMVAESIVPVREWQWEEAI